MLPMKRPRLMAVQPLLPFSLELIFIDGQQLRLDLSAEALMLLSLLQERRDWPGAP